VQNCQRYGLDPDGISLRAIQALDERTTATSADTSQLQTDVLQLEAQNAALKAELESLKRALALLATRR